MRKLISIILSLILCISLCACGSQSKGSGVLVEELKETIQEFDDDGVLTVAESEEGYTFKYEGSILSGDLVLTGKADKNNNIIEIKANGDSINVDYFDSLTASQLVKDMADWEHIAMNKLAGEFMLWDFSYITKICSKDKTSDDQMLGLDILLAARNSPQTNNGWIYTVSSDSNAGTVTITAVYGEANK